MSSPESRGWGGPGVDAADLRTVECPGPYPLHVDKRAELIFRKLVAGIAEIRRRYGLSEIKAYGAYNKRYISGTTVWSRHSWALAVDLNAETNPYSYAGETDYPAAARAEIRAMCQRLGIRWGLDYTGKKDAMHFEYEGTVAEAAALTRVLLLSPVSPAPGQSDDRSLDVDLIDLNKASTTVSVQGKGIRPLQRLLGVDADGYAGPATKTALGKAQKRLGTAVDYVFGPTTAEKLLAEA